MSKVEIKTIIQEVILSLSMEEAIALRSVLQYVGGDPKKSRAHIDAIDDSLGNNGVTFLPNFARGSITISEEEE